MPERKRHILIDGFVSNEDFRSKRTGRNPIIPLQDRLAHGQYLTFRYTELVNQFETQRTQIQNSITEDVGIYVEIFGAPGCELPLDSLDTSRDFKLRSCRKVDDHEVALIFIPESKRDVFQKKLNQYLDPEKDGKVGPRNHNLVDSITEIKLADLRSFWTDDSVFFPENLDQIVWWELWLKKRSADEKPLYIAQQLAERINGRLGNTSLSFFDSVVVLVRASARQLERAPELIACLEELRRAKETPNVFIESSPIDQHQWANDLLQRMQFDETASTAVTILDTGVNFQHPLLASVCNAAHAERWMGSKLAPLRRFQSRQPTRNILRSWVQTGWACCIW